MSTTTIRFTDKNGPNTETAQLRQQRVIPVAQLMYTDSHNLPKSLSQNCMLYTTDTRELFIGTGSGIKRVNLGSDGEIIDKTDYLTKTEAAQYYVQKEYLDPATVITQDKLETYVSTLGQTIDQLMQDNNFKADKEDVYTKLETNNNFIDNREFDTGMSKKVDQEILTVTGNHSFIQNIANGPLLKFQNVANNTESYICAGKNDIRLYVKKTNGDMFGGRLYITPDGAFYTSTNDEDFGKNDELLTQKDLVAVQDLLERLREDNETTRQIAMRSVESARNSELNVEAALRQIATMQEQVGAAVATANDARDIASRIEGQLNDAYVNSQSALQKAEDALDTAEAAKHESNDALSYVHNFESSIVTQLNQVIRDVNILKSGGVEPEPTPDEGYVIVSVETFEDVYPVPYETTSDTLSLPATVDVGLDSSAYAGDIVHQEIEVDWLVDRFKAGQTNYLQTIIGVPKEGNNITNPNHMFSLYTVRVLPEDAPGPVEPYKWSVVFALPKMADAVENFGTIIGHPEITSEDMMGDFDARGNYVNPTIELFLIGTLNEERDNTKCFVLTTDEQQTQLNHGILDITENGFKVPIEGIATDAEIAEYESTTLTRAFVNANGAYYYTEGTLGFDHGTDANNVYLIRMKNNIY